jgi:hypothetical protein
LTHYAMNSPVDLYDQNSSHLSSSREAVIFRPVFLSAVLMALAMITDFRSPGVGDSLGRTVELILNSLAVSIRHQPTLGPLG